MGAVLYGFLGFGVSNALAYYALISVKAGLASVVLSLAPVTTLFLASIQGQERLSGRGLTGAAVAIAGTAIVFNEQLTLAIPVAALIALVGVVFANGETNVVLKRFHLANPLATNAVATLVGAAFLLALSVITHEPLTFPAQTSTIISLIYLVVVGTVLVSGLYLFVISRWTASATSYAFVLVPLVTVVVAFVLAGEAVTPTFLAGTALVLVGVYFGAISRSPNSK